MAMAILTIVHFITSKLCFLPKDGKKMDWHQTLEIDDLHYDLLSTLCTMSFTFVV